MKKLFIIALVIFILGFLLDCWKTDGTCNQSEKVSFRGIHFQFPIKVSGVLKTPMSGFSRYHTQLQTDSINSKNISGKWFFEWEYDMSKPSEITDTVREQLIFGVAFELHEDSCKTDQEIITELQKTYPGNYVFHEKYGIKYFKWEQDCLTIFIKRIHQKGGFTVPEISFCYGLSDMQAYVYGLNTGYINNYPD